MSKLLRRFYLSICRRIYSVGKKEYENSQTLNFLNQVTSKDTKCFHNGSSVVNLSSIRDKINIGLNCHIYGQIVVYPYGGQIIIGANSSLGDNSRIVSSHKITIGDRVMIAHNVNIIDNNSHPKDAKLRHEDFIFNFLDGMKKYDLNSKEIIIEDDVWIGFNSIILKGVRIGRGAIIGAGSLVTHDVEAWTINVGNPLRCIEKLIPPENF